MQSPLKAKIADVSVVHTVGQLDLRIAQMLSLLNICKLRKSGTFEGKMPSK